MADHPFLDDEFKARMAAPAIAHGTVSPQERGAPGATDVVVEEPSAPPEFDEVTTASLTSAMRDLEESWRLLHNAAKRLYAAGVGSPLHQNVSLLADAVREEEKRLVNYMGGTE